MRENFSYATQPLMKFKLVLFLIMGFVIIHGYPGKAISGEKTEEEKDRLLVVPLKAKKGIDQEEASVLTDILSVEIIRSDLFTVLNRDDMKAILSEKEFELAMGCDEDNICLLQNVAKLAVNKVIAGSIGMLGKKYIVSIKLINKDGQTERMLKESCSCPIEDLEKTIETISYRFLKNLGGKVQDGSIRAESMPRGAKIYLDGDNIGTTPDSIRHIVPGTYVVKTDDKVKIHCTVSLKDGTVFQNTRPGKPLEFIVGNEQMPRGLERAVKGMKLNEKKKVTVEANDAYGKRDEGLVMKFVRADLPENFVPVIGKTIKIQELGGTIVNVDEVHVFLDCNHPLAGKDVIFDIRVVGIE